MNQMKVNQLHALIAAEHSRLHVVGAWPKSARKEALIHAIQSSLGQLTSADDNSFRCMICRTPVKMIAIRPSPQTSLPIDFQGLAA